MNAVGAVQLQHVAVVREEANRLVRPPRQQRLEVGDNGRKRGFHRTHARRQAFLGLGFEASCQLLDGVGQQRHAAQIEQLQRAVGLMDLVARIAQAVDVLLVREEALQAVDGLRQRRPDLVDDPGERRNVRRRADQLVGVMCLRHLSSPIASRPRVSPRLPRSHSRNIDRLCRRFCANLPRRCGVALSCRLSRPGTGPPRP